jgi:hypothetical protein
MRQVSAEATVGSDAELAPRHLRCGHRRSAEQGGSPREDRIDRGAVRLHHGLGSPLARQVRSRAADAKDHINLQVQISRAARDQQ